jgi:hypothetical protein
LDYPLCFFQPSFFWHSKCPSANNIASTPKKINRLQRISPLRVLYVQVKLLAAARCYVVNEKV